MKWLVTGGAGCIGSLFSAAMLARGDSVHIIDDCAEPRNEWNLLRLPTRPISITRERLEKMTALPDLLGEVDAVLHAAASTGIPYSATEPGDDWTRNAEASRVLLDALRKTPRPAVFMSTVKPYKITDETRHRGVCESDELSADEPYAASKAASSLLAQAYARSFDLPITILRFSNLYGPALSHGPRHNWSTWMAVSAAIGRPLRVEGAGTQTRDLLFHSDITAAILAALSIPQTGEIYNVGGGSRNRISVSAVAKLLQELTGVPIVSAPARRNDDDHVFACNTKFEAATGWSPLVDPIGGVREILGWATRHRRELSAIYRGVE